MNLCKNCQIKEIPRRIAVFCCRKCFVEYKKGKYDKNFELNTYQFVKGHIPWSNFKELRFEMSNCITLCSKCHYQITYNKPMPKDISTWGNNFSQRRATFQILK